MTRVNHYSEWVQEMAARTIKNYSRFRLQLIDREARIGNGHSEFSSICNDIHAQYGCRNVWLFGLRLLLHVTGAKKWTMRLAV